MTTYGEYRKALLKILGMSKMEEDNGVHRQTGEEVHGSTTGSSSGSLAGGTFDPYSQPVATGGYSISSTGNITYTAQYPGQIVPVTAGWNTLPLVTVQTELVPQPVDEGIKVGEILANRCWPIKSGFLWSTASGRVWAPGEIMSADEGHIKDGLGVYSFKNMSRCVQEFWDTHPCSSEGLGYAVAFGTVLIWGEIVEHELGYRSQYAKMQSIEIVKGVGPRLWYPGYTADLRKLYKVDGNEGKAS